VYFVTICTHSRECLFGDVVGEMRLNDAGQMVRRIWNDLPIKYPGIEIDEFVVMPNHAHGIIIVVGAQFIASFDCDTINRNKKQGVMNHAPTVGEIVRAFKARCTHAINQIRTTPGYPVWQRNYYEHIIRGEGEMNRIRRYIIDNPAK
jgi:REP element-mobilizing transposase RayT